MICPDCKDLSGRGGIAGVTHGRDVLGTLVHLLVVAATDARFMELTRRVGLPVDLHPWLQDVGIKDVSVDLVELTTGLCGREPRVGTGHDGIDIHTAVEKIITAAGLDPNVWGLCKTCGGSTEISGGAHV